MANQVAVCVSTLSGRSLEQDMQASDSFGTLKEYISTEWGVDAKGFRLLSGSMVLEDTAEIQSLEIPEDRRLKLQLVKFDPLPKLGLFDVSRQSGISATDNEGKPSEIVKTSEMPDSNNVFLQHPIREPCFVEFRVVRTRDEISFGVTYEKEHVERVSGFGNLGLKSTWLYSKRQSMPVLQFGGAALRSGDVAGVQEGDLIAVFADPSERLVKFYKNGECVASNLPDHPLPESDSALYMYVMLDQTQDAAESNNSQPALGSRAASCAECSSR